MTNPRQDQQHIRAALRASIEDLKMSRGEKKALREVLEDFVKGPEDRAFVRGLLFDVARDQDLARDGHRVLSWIEDGVRLLEPRSAEASKRAEAHFSPGQDCRNRIDGLLRSARHRADICVFTITDDRLSKPIVEAHRRGVRLRVITDNDKSYDKGSDFERLERAGVPIVVDASDHHMHHKYAIFDNRTLLTGSYNWTRSAAEYNRENVVVSDDPRLVQPFQREFDDFWSSLKSR